MRTSLPFHLIGYIFGGVMLAMGVLLLTGVLMPQGSVVGGSDLARTIFGVVLILFGIYRMAMTWSRAQAQRREGLR